MSYKIFSQLTSLSPENVLIRAEIHKQVQYQCHTEEHIEAQK